MLNKKYKHDRLIWIDLEMTGLDYQKDVILEIATIITDGDLHSVAIGPNLVIHQPDSVLEKMNDIVTQLHIKSGLYEAIQKSTITLEQAEQATLTFLEQHCNKSSAPLCGNSVWFDKLFLHKDMPNIYNFLHYRIVDVTSLKVMINLWTQKDIPFPKKNNHRALDDIKESIAELAFYKEHYIKLSHESS